MFKNAMEGRLNPKQKKSKFGNLPSDAGVRDLLIANKIEEAIDLYQRFTGVDKFTAQRAIEDIEREIRLSTFQHNIEEIFKTQGKAAAIEAYQVSTGSNLSEALAYVEEIERS
jgi:hypothetical protein